MQGEFSQNLIHKRRKLAPMLCRSPVSTTVFLGPIVRSSCSGLAVSRWRSHRKKTIATVAGNDQAKRHNAMMLRMRAWIFCSGVMRARKIFLRARAAALPVITLRTSYKARRRGQMWAHAFSGSASYLTGLRTSASLLLTKSYSLF
jgi:hypothetical protein